MSTAGPIITDPTDDFVLAIYGEHLGSSQASACTGDVGWFWYCDDHDTHGNADDEQEARAMLAAHCDYIRLNRPDDGACEGLYAFHVGAAGDAYHDRHD